MPEPSPRRVLVTDAVHDVLPRGLRALGYTVEYEPDITLAEVRDRAVDYEGLIINSKILIDRDLLDSAPGLRWVGRLGSGLEIVDRAYAKTRGVSVISSPEGNAPAVGEHALAMVLCLANKLIAGDGQVRRHAWDREAARGWELKYRSVGIIGYGHTGPAFAKTLRGFGCPVVAYDKYRVGFTAATPWVRAAASAREVIEDCDVVSLHLPLTDETRGYLGAVEIGRMRPGAVLVNTSRGLAIDLTAVVEALESGHLGGACLDVFPNEKTATFSPGERAVMDRLAALPNVVLSPHVAGWTTESKRALARIVLDRVAALDGDR